jgi:tetratricopeptide (TPR) repeat protein
MTGPEPKKGRSPSILWIGGLLAVCIALLLFLRRDPPSDGDSLKDLKPSPPLAVALPGPPTIRHNATRASADPASAQAIVARKLTQYSKKQRALFDALAKKHNLPVPDDVKRFFDAVEAGNWPEADAIFKSLSAPGNPSGSRSEQLRPIWRTVQETWGAAHEANIMPAQQLLDYGNSVLDSLQPGAIYIGGSDPGLFIPSMLNATSASDPHVMLTQNALADISYLNYLSDVYGDQLKTLTADESQQAFQAYYQDAQQRLQHDQQFPDEPKQVLPSEDIKQEDGRLSISGQTAVMAINERLLQTLMQNNPDASFALEESFSLPSTYPGAVPAGPIMQLRAGQNPVTPDVAAQTVNYWSTAAQNLMADPEAAGSPETMLLYSHEATAQANLLAADNYNSQAEQAYNLASQLAPTNFDAIRGLSTVLSQSGQTDQAIQILNDFAQKNPDQQAAVARQRNNLIATKK